MDAQIESLVELYLTRGGKVFVSPQYDIPYSKEEKDGGTCPDFVALDMDKQEIVIVEVSSAWRLNSLFSKIRDREKRWFEPIKRRLGEDGIAKGWKARFIGFIRHDRIKCADTEFPGLSDVCFFPLEHAAFSFAYWTEREKGLPRETVVPADQADAQHE